MKKLISLALIVSCIFTFGNCSQNEVDKIKPYFNLKHFDFGGKVTPLMICLHKHINFKFINILKLPSTMIVIYTNKESVVLKTYFRIQVLEYLWDKISNSPTPYPNTGYDAGRCPLILFTVWISYVRSARINLHFPRN